MTTTSLRRYLALSAAVMSLAACQSNSPDMGAYTPQTVPYDPAIRGEVEQQLAQSAARSANALETLAMIQRTRTEPTAPTLDESTLPPELKRKATVAFTGPADELAKRLAENIGYGFIETGHTPSSPGLITVDDHDVSVAKALEDVGLQAAKFATVIVDPNARRVEFRNDNMGSSMHAVASGERVLSRRTLHAVHRHVARHPSSCTYCAPPAASAE